MSMFSRKKSGGFTLIELLVVVSIIALLISILLPSLRKAREQAKVAVCIAGLKGMATGSITYASDDRTEASIPVHEDVLDTAVTDNGRRAIAYYCYGGKSGREIKDAAARFENDPEFWGTSSGRGPARRPLNNFLFKDGFTDYTFKPGPDFTNWRSDERLSLDGFRCPSDTGYKGIHYTKWDSSGMSSYDYFGTSFAANCLWIHYVGGSDCQSNSPFWRPLSRIPNPANTIMYTENVGHFAYRAKPQGSADHPCELSEGDDGVIMGWHGREWFFDASFADAHAATIKMQGYENPRLEEYPTGDLDDPDGAYDIWRCVIIRGRGWQKDTLPAPPVWTDIWCPD